MKVEALEREFRYNVGLRLPDLTTLHFEGGELRHMRIFRIGCLTPVLQTSGCLRYAVSVRHPPSHGRPMPRSKPPASYTAISRTRSP
jgi:hypothetical protein